MPGSVQTEGEVEAQPVGNRRHAAIGLGAAGGRGYGGQCLEILFQVAARMQTMGNPVGRTRPDFMLILEMP